MVKYIEGKETQLITFEELAKLASKEGIKTDKVSVGIWAKSKGYTKTRKQIANKVYIGYYIKDSE